jgi:hypothetical protein
MIRDGFHISTWLLLGGLLTSVLSFVFPRSYIFFPIIITLLYRIIDAYLQFFGFRRNPYYDNVIHGKFAVGFPNTEDGEAREVTGKPGDNGPGAVMILAARVNSPLGVFAYGGEELGKYFGKQLKKLEDTAEESGCE